MVLAQHTLQAIPQSITTTSQALCLCKVALPPEIRQFVHASTGNYGKVKLVLQRNAFFVESPFPDVLHTLLQVLTPTNKSPLYLGGQIRSTGAYQCSIHTYCSPVSQVVVTNF